MAAFPRVLLAMVGVVGNSIGRTIIILAAVLGIVLFTANSEAADRASQNSATRSLLWGPYKPNLYFGVRPRLPKSLTAGLLWSGLDSYEQFQNSTNLCVNR